MKKDERIILWHDCLDCGFITTEHCPLSGGSEIERICDRISRTEEFMCDKFLESMN